MTDDPIKRFTMLVLFQAWQDEATELVIGSSPGLGAYIKFRVAGSLYELSPPPAQIIPDVIAELGRLAGLPDGAFPKRGIIDMKLSTGRAKWKIQMASADAECLLTAIRE
jgi:hypothetical protein